MSQILIMTKKMFEGVGRTSCALFITAHLLLSSASRVSEALVHTPLEAELSAFDGWGNNIHMNDWGSAGLTPHARVTQVH